MVWGNRGSRCIWKCRSSWEKLIAMHLTQLHLSLWWRIGGGTALVAAAVDCLECGAHMLRTMRTHWYTEALIRILDLSKWEDSNDDFRVPEKYEASHLTHQYKVCSFKFCYMFCWKSQHRNLWSRFKPIARSHDKPDNSQWLELTTGNFSDM